MRFEISWRIVGRFLIEILPIAGALTVVSITLNQTQLALSESANLTVTVLALLFGVALVRSRFPGWAAALYNGLLSLFTALEVASGFLPLAEAVGLMDNLGAIGYMHNRLIFFFDQLLSWWSAYALGDPIRERAVSVFIVGFLLWNLIAWLVWWTLRRRRALIGAIPLSLCLALVVDRSSLSLGYLQSFLFFVFVIHVSNEIASRYRDWSDRGIDHPEGLEFEWGISATVIIVFVIFSARAIPLLATPEGWDTIREWLQREEPVVIVGRDGTSEQYKSITSMDTSSPELEVIGDAPASGEAVVMWVQISDPPPMPPEIPGSPPPPLHYWRSRIYTTYTGRGWEPLEVIAYDFEPDMDGTPVGRYSLEQTYSLDATNGDVLYAVNWPYVIMDTFGERSLGGDGVIPSTVEGLYTYSIQSWATSLTLSELQSATSNYPEIVPETYLQLPEELPVRVGDLAARLTHGLSNNYEKAKRIETYLRANYPYTLEVPKAPDQRDVVDYFLFEAEGGFCSYYASAMTVMLRSIGIPARVVSGYAMGSYDPEMAAYKVVEGDSHAWVEVYFPELGWVEFEPTASRATFPHSDQEPSTETMDEPLIVLTPSSQTTLILMVGGAGFLALAVLIGIRVVKRLHQDPYGLQRFGVAGKIYLEMRSILYRTGFHGHPAQTPHEYLDGLSRELASEPAIFQSLQQATEIYTHVRFGGFHLSEEDSRELQAMWQQSKQAWRAFSLKQRACSLRDGLMDRFRQLKPGYLQSKSR
jgi:transglutaminase-like putative cysteine protease